MRSLDTAFKHIRRSPYQALSAIFVLATSFFVMIIFALVAIASQSILRHFETRPQVIAYLKEGVSQDQTNPLITQLKDTGLVPTVKYVSKEEALAIYKQSVGNDPLLLGTITDLSSITADILPASLEISVADPESFPKIIAILQSSDLIGTNAKGDKDIDFPQDVVRQLTDWTKALRSAGLILIVVIAFSSLLSISTLVSMKIRSRRTEIQTIKLLGAPNSFIIKPYLFETSLYSLIGAVIGWVFAYTALLYATPFLSIQMSGIITMPPPPLFMLSLLGASLLAALIFGLISGLIAGSRFSRAK